MGDTAEGAAIGAIYVLFAGCKGAASGPGGMPSAPVQAATDSTPDASVSATPTQTASAAPEDAGAPTKGRKKHKK